MFREVRELSDDDLELAQHLGGAARGALERSELFERERTSRALAQQLARTGGLLATELDPAAVLEEVVGQAPAPARRRRRRDPRPARRRARRRPPSRARAPSGTRRAQPGRRRAGRRRRPGPCAGRRSPTPSRRGWSPRTTPSSATGCRAFLGVPLYATEGDLQGVLAVYAREPRDVARGGDRGARGAGGERVGRARERRALPAGRAGAGAARRDPRATSRTASSRSTATAQVVLWNAAAERDHRRAAGRGARPHAVRRCSSATSRQAAQRRRPARADPPRRRGGLALGDARRSCATRPARSPAASSRSATSRPSAIVEQMKSDFVSTVSHELRPPLTSIYGFAETLLRRDVLFAEEERRTFLGYIASEAERLTVDRRPAAERRAARRRRPRGRARADRRRARRRARPSSRSRASGSVERPPLRRRPAERAARRAGRPRRAAADPRRAGRERGQVLARRRDGHARGAAAARRGRGARRRRGHRDRRPTSTSGSSASSTASATPRPAGTGLGLFIVQGLVARDGRAHLGRLGRRARARSFVFELPVARGEVTRVRGFGGRRDGYKRRP